MAGIKLCLEPKFRNVSFLALLVVSGTCMFEKSSVFHALSEIIGSYERH